MQFFEKFLQKSLEVIKKYLPLQSQTKRMGHKRGSSSVGRAQPCQGWGREFEPRLPLQKKEVSRNADLLFETKSTDRIELRLTNIHPTGFHYMSVVLVHKVGFFVIKKLLATQIGTQGVFILVCFCLKRSLEFLEEAEVILEIVSKVADLPLEHCDTLHTHTEGETAVFLAVDT